jgi:hypothetical protein
MSTPVEIVIRTIDQNTVQTAKGIQKEMDAMKKSLQDAGVSQSAYNRALAESDKAQQKNKISMTDLNSAVQLAERGLQMLKQGYDATIGATLEYANQVRSLSQISGESAEDTSRFIQVLDDYKIGTENVTTATRALTSQGLAPTIDTLAQLSDQYLKLSSTEEKNAFVIKNLGRSGLQWVEVLNKGSEAIKKQGDAVAKGLILNQKQLDQARKLEIAQDTLGESWQQLSMTIGNALIPAVTEATDEFNNTARAMEIMQEQGIGWGAALDNVIMNTDMYTDALKQANDETNAQRDAMLQNTEAMQANEETLKAQEAAVKAADEYNRQFASTVMNLASEMGSYRDKQAAVVQEYRNGSITADEYNAKMGELGEEHKSVINGMILDLLQVRLAADGAFDDADLNTYLTAAEKLGIITKQDKDAALELYESVGELESGLDEAADPMLHVGKRAEDADKAFGGMARAAAELGEGLRKDAASGASALTAALNQIPTQIDVFVNIHTRGNMPTFASAGGAGAAQNTAEIRDSGGPGLAGSVYMIGSGAQPEAFIPNTNGTFVPNIDKALGTRDDTAIIAAIERNKIDERRLARSIVTAMAQAGM